MPPFNPLRHQLASTSPLSLGSMLAAARAAITNSSTPRPDQELRRRLCADYGVADAVLCGSGTEALLLALRTAERLIGEPTTVVLPSFSCFDVAAAAVALGKPVTFYDLDPATLGPDPASLRRAAEGGPRTILISSLFGLPPDWDTLDPILTATESFVVEDAAQGHGALWRGERLGAHGRLGVLSFGRGKGWTGGAGGALLVRTPEDLVVLGHSLPDLLVEATGAPGILARAAAHWALGRPGLYGVPRSVPALGLGETRYHPVGEPRHMAPTAAALALGSRETAEEWARRRSAAAERYRDRLSASEFRNALVHPARSGAPGYVRFPIVPARGMASFRDPREAARLGAAPSYPIPLPALSEIRPLLDPGALSAEYPGARVLSERLVTLPTHPLASERERDRLTELLTG